MTDANSESWNCEGEKSVLNTEEFCVVLVAADAARAAVETFDPFVLYVLMLTMLPGWPRRSDDGCFWGKTVLLSARGRGRMSMYQ